MFRWLFNLLSRFSAKKLEDSYELYHPRERMIYRYFNGKEDVAVDPIQLSKKMAEIWPELVVDIKVARSQSKDSAKAHDSLVAGIRDLFNVKSLEDGGLTELETIQLLDHFLAYTEDVKKNLSPSATLWNSSGAFVNSSEENQPTLNSSVSGSIENVSSGESQDTQPTEPVLQSER